MHLRLIMGIGALVLAVCSADADLSFVNSKDVDSVTKTVSYFDAWSPSMARQHGVAVASRSDVWERLQFVTYRMAAYQIDGVKTPAEDLLPDAPSLEPAPTFAWKSFSLENMYQVWDSPDFPVAVSLSIQPRTSDENVNVQETFVIGRSYDFWKWALNFSQGTEWSNRIKERDGAMELAWEMSRDIGKHWSVGLEVRDHSDLPEYRRIAASGVFLGPVVRCRQDNWWMAVSVLPRILNFEFVANSDTPRDITFDTNQKLTTRVMFGLCF